MDFQNIIVEKKNGIAKVTLNRPRVLNAMNAQTRIELKTAMEELRKDDSVNVVILTGAGRAFSSGMDIKEAYPPNFAQQEIEMFDAISSLGKPIIAAVNGYCVTGGLTLALACDMIIASENAIFGDTHASISSVTHAGGANRMARLMGTMRAKEFLLSSGFMSAEEADKVGLVNRVVAPNKLEESVEELAKRILSNNQASVRALKCVIDRGMEVGLQSGLLMEQLEFRRFRESQTPEEIKEGRRAVFEKTRELLRKKSGG